MVMDGAISIFRNMKALYEQFAAMEITVAVIETRFAGSQRFYFSACQRNACYKTIFNKIFMKSGPVSYLTHATFSFIWKENMKAAAATNFATGTIPYSAFPLAVCGQQ